MATIKQLKKDFDHLTFAVIEDCIARYNLTKDKEAEVSELVESTVQYRQEVRKRINAHKKITSSKEKKQYFNDLVAEFLKNTHDRFTRLSEIIQQ
ncbi:MAG: hypothetical protein LBK12_06100 [Odoribacteraceae bacterium]|jgi:hypothetical protein|nr:hypothetical protein [Odoribacteraceae bacterium]